MCECGQGNPKIEKEKKKIYSLSYHKTHAPHVKCKQIFNLKKLRYISYVAYDQPLNAQCVRKGLLIFDL